MNLSADFLIKLLLKAGFIFKRQKGSHKIYYRAKDNLTVVVPYHKGKDLPKGTFMKIIKQAEINL